MAKSTIAKVAIAGLLGSTLIVGGAAQGAGTPATAVTSSGIKSLDIYASEADYFGGQRRTVSGTASNLSVSTINLVCLDTVTGEVDVTLSSNVTVTAGKWSTKAWIWDLSNITCRLAAVPTDTSVTGETAAAKIASMKSFTGPVVRVFEIYEWSDQTAVYGQKWQGDPGLTVPSTKASYTIWGVEDGGLYNWYTRADGKTSQTGNISNSAVWTALSTGPSKANEAGLVIDGKQAFSSYNMDRYDNNSTAANSPKYSYSVSSTTGIGTYTETYPLFRCAYPEVGTLYSSISSCPDDVTVKLQVSWKRVTTMSADGTIAKITNTFATLDGKAHTVRYDERWQTYSANGYRYATSGAFGSQDNTVDSDGPVRTAISGLGVKTNKDAATSVTNPITQIVFITKPGQTWTLGSYGTPTYSRWTKTIPAGKGKSISIITGAALITSDATAASKIATASR